eukprot:12460551-Prorocentrum_lima.AAC.1
MAGQSDPHSPFGQWLASGRPAGLMPMGFLPVPPSSGTAPPPGGWVGASQPLAPPPLRPLAQ